jgi:LysR family glycine cleavage system transcriptional activator
MSSWWYRLLIRPSRERDPAVMAAANWIRDQIGPQTQENTLR